jgi:hypothetical protein
MLVASLGAAVISLAPIPLLLFGISESKVRLIGCVFLGTFLAAASLWATRSGGRLARFPKVFWTALSVSWGFTALQLVGVAGLFGLPRPAVFAAGLWWLVFLASTQFLAQAVAATRS